MTIAPITLAVIGAVFIIALLGLACWARVKADLARSNGYDQGYSDSQFAASEYRRVLEEQLASNINRLASANLQREAIIRDADERIAIFAGRSYIRADLALLQRAAKQLKAAGLTFAKFPNNGLADQAQAALYVSEQLESLAQRIEQQLEDAPTSHAQSLASAFKSGDLLDAALAAATTTNGKSWFVYGPEGCGKTSNAQAIAAALGLTEIVDNWEPGQPVPITKALVLTTENLTDSHIRRRLTFEQAMALVASKAKQGAAA